MSIAAAALSAVLRRTSVGTEITQAYWPPMPARKRERTMAVATLDGDILIEGHSAMRLRCPDWAAFTQRMESMNLELVCNNMGAWRWFPEASSDPRTFVLHGKGGQVRGIVWQGRRRRFWVMSSRVWGGREADRSLCRDLEAVAAATGIGQWSTPSRLGDALQRRAWFRRHGWRWESRPKLPARDRLLGHGVGGRGQTISEGSRYTGVWEIDQRDAYAYAWSLRKPSGSCGTAEGVLESEGSVTAFGPIEFEITEPLKCLGPLPIREGDQLRWPTHPGVYRTWAWLEECRDAQAAGVTVRSDGPALCWRKWVTEPGWTAELSEIRRGAGGWGSAVKLATVAGIGRHGRQPEAWVEVQRQQKGDVRYGPGSRAYGRRRVDPPAMAHWYSYALMQARRRVWHRAVAEEWGGRRVIAVETDALILDGPPLGPCVHRGDDGPGEWSVRRADCEVWTPVLRWAIFGDGEGRTPGLPGEMRAGWLAAHAPPGIAC